MTIKVGDRVPEATLFEFIEVEGNGCSVGPNAFKVEEISRGKKSLCLACLVRSPRPARPSMCQAMSSISMPSKPRVSMKFGVCRSTMPS